MVWTERGENAAMLHWTYKDGISVKIQSVIKEPQIGNIVVYARSSQPDYASKILSHNFHSEVIDVICRNTHDVRVMML